MFDKLKDMGNLMKQAKEMKAKMQQVQDELKKTIVESEVENGKIIIKMTGELECTNLTIDDSLMNDKEKLAKLLVKAINKCATKSKQLATKQLSDISGGLNLPGM